jgi:hypothetical protein
VIAMIANLIIIIEMIKAIIVVNTTQQHGEQQDLQQEG